MSNTLALANPEPAQFKMVCPKHGDVPFLIVEAGEYMRTYCLICFDEVMIRLGVHFVRPVAVEPEPIEWPEALEVE